MRAEIALGHGLHIGGSQRKQAVLGLKVTLDPVGLGLGAVDQGQPAAVRFERIVMRLDQRLAGAQEFVRGNRCGAQPGQRLGDRGARRRHIGDVERGSDGEHAVTAPDLRQRAAGRG